jgi:hypothetical protein
LPAVRLIAISHADAALTATFESGAAIAAWASSRSRRSPLAHQMKTRVSSRSSIQSSSP